MNHGKKSPKRHYERRKSILSFIFWDLFPGPFIMWWWMMMYTRLSSTNTKQWPGNGGPVMVIIFLLFCLSLLRLVVWCLWSIQPKRDVLHPGSPCWQTQWHQVALFQGSKLLSPGNYHDDPTAGLFLELLSHPQHKWEHPSKKGCIYVHNIIEWHFLSGLVCDIHDTWTVWHFTFHEYPTPHGNRDCERQPILIL